MKIGVNTLLWTAAFDRSHFELLPRIKRWGFDGVEIARFDFDDFPIGRSAPRRRRCGPGVHVLFGADRFAQPHQRQSRNTSGCAQFHFAGHRDCGRTRVAGFRRTVLRSGRVQLLGRRRSEDEWKRAVEELSSLGDALDSHGVTIALEALNRFETYFLNTAADAARLCREVNHPRVGVLLDTFHANIEEKTIGEAAAALGPLIKHVHTCENDRGIPGSGHVDWEDLFNGLSRTGYDHWLVIESFGFAIKEIAAAACIWRDIAPNPEAIAVEGVRFLQGFTRGGALARTV